MKTRASDLEAIGQMSKRQALLASFGIDQTLVLLLLGEARRRLAKTG
ncbi:hypothetical protein ACEK06_30290 [Pseudomonas brenneri]